MENLRIQTTQNVGIDHELATLGDRSLAWLIDKLISIAWIIILWQFRDVFGPTHEIESNILFMVIALLPIGLYHLLFELFANGQSIGKMVLRIKVIRTDGAQPTVGNYLIRWLVRIIEFLLFNGLALLAFLIIGKGQRLGDLFAGTTVIRIRRRVTLEETAYKQLDPSYIPTYPQASNLTYRDVETIKESLFFAEKSKNYLVLAEAFVKVQEVLSIDNKSIPHRDFLQTIVNDFNHYKLAEYYNE